MPRAGLRSSGKTANVAAEMKALLKRLLAVERVVLSKELAEALRHRELTWSLIPPLMRKLALPFLTLKETLTLDTAVSERGEDDERDHLTKAYKGLRSPSFDEWVFKGTKIHGFVGLRWARKRGIDLRHLKLEYEGLRGDQALGRLVLDENKEMATYYTLRSDARDTDIVDFDDESYESTSLIKALKRGYLEVAKCLIDRGADVNKADSLGRTPLFWASSNGHLEIVQTLLNAKAKVNKADIAGQTPLFWASFHGHLEVVQTLLDAKAKVNKADDKDKTPLYWASYNGHLEVVQTLLDAKAEVNKASNVDKTPLYWASFHGHLEVVQTLLDAKAKVNKADIAGFTPLYLASFKGHLEVVQTLLDAKAEVNKATSDGSTPLSGALSENHPEVATLLREAGAHEPQPH